MKRWGTRPYSRSVHYTESILLARLPKVKNICTKVNRFFRNLQLPQGETRGFIDKHPQPVVE